MPICPAFRGITLIPRHCSVLQSTPHSLGFRLPARSPALRDGGRGALHLGIFDQPEKIFFTKSSNCSTRKPFINHKASAIIFTSVASAFIADDFYIAPNK